MQYVVNKFLIKQLDQAVEAIRTTQLEEEGKPGGSDPARDYVRDLERVVNIFITHVANAHQRYCEQEGKI